MAEQLPEDDEMKTRKTPEARPSDVGDDDMLTRPTPPGAGSVGPGSSGFAPTPAAGRPAAPHGAHDARNVADETIVAGRYVVVRRIAEGGFGVVFEGYYTISGNRIRVAIKLLRASKHLDHATAVRFDEEVRTLCHLQHPNICRVIDGGLEPGTDRPFLVMDYADGGTLKGKLQGAPNGLLDHDLVLRWFEEAALGLLAAEKNVNSNGEAVPVYHRDVKPENLLLQKGRVVVADFGAARLGGDFEGVTSEVVPQLWTPAYGSPEQDGGSADHRSDIYALGTSFYHLLTGEITARRFENAADRFQFAHDPCERRSSVPRELGAIIRRMTEPKPLDRYQSFAEVLADLQKLKVAPVARWPRFVLAGVAAGALLVGGLETAGVTDWFGTKVVQARELGEVRVECGEQLVRVQELLAGDWTLLPALLQRVEQLAGNIEQNQKLVTELAEAASDDQRVPLPESFVASVAEDLSALESRTDALRALRTRFLAAQGRLAKAPTAQVASELGKLAMEIRDYADSDELLGELRHTEELVASAARERGKKVRDLEQRLQAVDAGDTDALALLRADVESAMRVLTDLGEEGLRQSAEQLVQRSRRAEQLQAELPAWSVDDGATVDIESLTKAFGELDRLAAKAADPVDKPLQGWLAGIAARLGEGWISAACRAMEAELLAVTRDVQAFNKLAASGVGGSPAGSPADGALDEASLERRLAAASSRRESLRKLAEKHGLFRALSSQMLASLPSLVKATFAGLEDYRRELANKSYSPEKLAQQPAPLLPMAARVGAAHKALAQRLDAMPSNPSLKQRAELDELRLSMRAALQLLDAGELELQNYQAAAAQLGSLSCGKLRELCRESRASDACDELNQKRLDQLQAIEAEWERREQPVAASIAALRAGSADPAGVAKGLLAAKVKLLGCGETALAQKAQQAHAAAQQAVAVLAKVPDWRAEPVGQGGQATRVAVLQQRRAQLAGFLAAFEQLGAIKAADPYVVLQDWWRARRKQIADGFCRDASSAWQELHQLHEQAAKDPPSDAAMRAALEGEMAAFAKLHGQLRDLVITRKVLAANLASAVALKEAPTMMAFVALPDGWPDAGFLPPEGVRSLKLDPADPVCRKLYSEEFLVDAKKAGLRLWYFEGRRVRRGDGAAPIYMAFCKDASGASAALVDVLPVTFGEIYQRPYISGISSYMKSGYRRKLAEDVAANSMQSEARKFADMVSGQVGGVDFGLPAGEFRSWPCCEPWREQVLAGQARPKATLPTVDVSVQGLCFLRTGVCEWTAQDDLAVGQSALKPSDPGVARRRDTGFRLAIALPRRDK